MPLLLRPLYALAIALLRLLSRWAAARPAGTLSKVGRSLALRGGELVPITTGFRRAAPPVPLVWLHAPSVGEGLQARPILNALRSAHPEWQLAYTWFSPSAERFADRLSVDISAPLPWDGRHEADTLLDDWRPSALVFVKLDVWPVLVERARARGIPVLLVSATLAPNSSRLRPLARWALGPAYRALSAVGAISADDAERLVALGVPRDLVNLTGDTRKDQVAERAASVGADHPVRLWEDRTRTTLIAGSTWPADEAVLLPAFMAWRAMHPTARLIIAPHEPTDAHCAPIIAWAVQHGLSLTRFREHADAQSPSHSPSQANAYADAEASRHCDVLLVDTIGVLGDLYAVGDIAFVGGGFHNDGLHSVLEPAAFGMPVLFGPRHHNAIDSAWLLERGGAHEVTSAASLADSLSHFTAHVDERLAVGSAARALVHDGVGSTARTVALIEAAVRA